MRERGKIAVGNAEYDRAHLSVGAGALVVAELFHRIDHVVDTLFRQARHLLLSGEIRQVAGPATQRWRKLRTPLNKGGINPLIARLRWELGKVVRQSVQLIVGQILHQGHHDLDPPHALAHQKKLVHHEELGLAGERRNVVHARIAVLAMATAAEFYPLVERHALWKGGTGVKKSGCQPESQQPPPIRNSVHQAVNCWLAAADN
jgi:hypothetical protein